MSGFLEAIRFLSIFPVPGKSKPESLGRATAFFPLIGLIFGLILFLANWLLLLILPEQISNIFLILVLLVLSGGIHLDGLADTCDGLFSGKGREEALKIMKDSRIGTFGVVAIALILLLKVSLLSFLFGEIKGAALIAMPIFGRFSTAFAAMLFGAAKEKGVGKSFSTGVGIIELVIAALTTVIVAVLLFRFQALPMLLGLVMFVLVTSFLISRRVGGMTGDTFGALIELTEAWTLLLAVAFL